MFFDYTLIEVQIFNGVKSYFESLPPMASDDYKNAFYDIVSQYGGGGEEYIMVGGEYEDLIESQILIEIEKLTSIEKSDFLKFYETHFLEEYLNEEGDGYSYTNEELAAEIAGRFKCWIDDNFSLDAMLEEDEEEEEEEENDDFIPQVPSENFKDLLENKSLKLDEFNAGILTLSTFDALSLREELADYMQKAAFLYSRNVDVWDFYYELTNNPETLKILLEAGGWCVNFNLDLHLDEQYYDFVTTLDEVVLFLINATDKYFIEVFYWSRGINVELYYTIINKGHIWSD